MNEKIEKLSAILYEIDPVGLVSSGCPKDEYSPEAIEYLKKFHVSDLSETEVNERMIKVFNKMFAPLSMVDGCTLFIPYAKRISEACSG